MDIKKKSIAETITARESTVLNDDERLKRRVTHAIRDYTLSY
jgi:hypothetical protein